MISLFINFTLMKIYYIDQTFFPAWRKAIPGYFTSFYKACSVLMVCCLPLLAQASPDFSIFLDGNSIQLSDQMGGNDIITVTEVAGNIQFNVPGRTYAINGGVILNFPVSIPLAGATSIVVFGGEGNDVINIGAFSTALPDFNVGGGDGNDVINFNGDITFLSNASFDVNLQDDAPVIGTDRITVAAGANLRLSGTGEAVLKASQSITVLAGGSVETDDGNLTVEANLQAAPSVGNFIGVALSNGILAVLGDGYLTVKGKGGNNAAGFQHGVSVSSTSTISGGAIHSTYIQGWGGPSIGIRNYGVLVEDASVISGGGSVTVIGKGNGTGASTTSHGVLVINNSLIITNGTGDVSVTGTGCTACAGINNGGVVIATANAQISSISTGDVTVTGFGGGTAASGSNMGVSLADGGRINAVQSGNINVTGTAGLGSGGNLRGVNISPGASIGAFGSGSVTVKGTGRESIGSFNFGVGNLGTISTTNGDVSVTGFAGGTGVSNNNYGVLVQNSGAILATISAGGIGNVRVVGNGAFDATGLSNIGVLVNGNLALIDTDNGNIEIIGSGGGSGASGLNAGVALVSQGKIIAGGNGKVSIQGMGGKGTSNGNMGVTLESSSLVSSGGGDVSVIGQGVGTGTSGQNYGVQVVNSILQAGTGGNVSVRGTAGNAVTGADNFGVLVNTGGQILANNGSIDITGQGGGQAPASGGVGVLVRLTGQVIATGSGAVTIKGTGGTGVGPSNIGVSLQNTSIVSSDNGNITITGIEGTSSLSNGIKMSETALVTSDANIELIANSILIGITASIVNNANNTVTLRQLTNGVAINLGPSTDPLGGPLNLSDAELDRVTTGKLVIGNNASGNITVTNPITRPAQTDVTLITGGAIYLNASSLNTAGGYLTFQAPVGGVFPTVAGVDVETGTVGFAPGTALNIAINGQVADVSYAQLNVVGMVNLTGAKLSLSGSFIQPQCAQVVLIKNDGADPVIGNFNGMPEGFLIVNYLGSGKNVSISYKGGDGNDVVLIERVIPIIACPANLVKNNDFGDCGRLMNFVGSPIVTENCGFNLSSNAPGFYGIGETSVTWVVTDANNNTASCIQTITIKDAEYPTFVCPANIVTLNQEDQHCGAVVYFDLSPSDNCPGYFVEQSHFSGDLFELGITKIEASITDASGNTNFCEFKIYVDPRPEICNDIDDDCDGFTDEIEEWALDTRWFANDPATNNRLGESVDMKGDWGIAGSNQTNAVGQQIGTAYLLYRDPNTGEWSKALQLFPDNTSVGDQFFGSKVAMGNGFCAVASPLDDENGINSGAIYIYKYNGNNPADWTLFQKIVGVNANEQIGSSLDFSNEMLLIGAILNSDNAPEAGAAYLYTQVPAGTGNWNLVKKLSTNDDEFGDHFGYDVAVSGSYAIVSANGDDEKGVNAGAAFVFRKDEGGLNNWGLIQKVMAPDGEDDDNFGVSVDLDGVWAVVGANKDDDKGQESGSAYVLYQNHGNVQNSWGVHGKLRDFNGHKGAHYGYSVSINGDFLAVGSRWKKVSHSRAGAVFVYSWENGGWIEFSLLTDPENAYNDNLGSSIALDDKRLMVGVPGEDLVQKNDCGAVLVFDAVCGENRPTVTGRFDTDQPTETMNLAVNCYPVPFNETLTIEVETVQEENVQVRVFDLLGREVAILFNGSSQGKRNLLWNAENLPVGNYFVRVSTAIQTVTQSVIRVK